MDQFLLENHLGFDNHHIAVPCVDFDYPEFNQKAEADTDGTDYTRAGEELRAAFQWVFISGARRMRDNYRRFLTLSSHIDWRNVLVAPSGRLKLPRLGPVAREGLEKLMAHCWRGGDARIAFIKFSVIVGTVQPSAIDGATWVELSRIHRCSKANISKHSRDFLAKFGNLQFRRSRLTSACERMRAARLAQRDASGRVIGRRTKAPTRLSRGPVVT